MATMPLDYGHEGVTLKGQLARPEGPGPHPAVLVMHDALGLGDMVCRRAADLAQAGYVALATDMYGTGLNATEDHGALFMALQEKPEFLRARVVRAYETLRGQPGVDAARIGAIGYCFGGQCVLELARSGAALGAAVSFHGLLTTQLPAKPDAVRARLLVITGALDPHVPIATVGTFQEEMTAAGADWQVTTYGSGYHAFTDPGVAQRLDIPGLRYDPFLDRLSWAQATEFLAATLS